jgi:hypothetical protein
MYAGHHPLNGGVGHDVEVRNASLRAATTPAGSSRLAPWCGWLLALMAGTLLLYGVDVVFHPLPSMVSEQFQGSASWAVFLGAAALCVMKGRASRDER